MWTTLKTHVPLSLWMQPVSYTRALLFPAPPLAASRHQPPHPTHPIRHRGCSGDLRRAAQTQKRKPRSAETSPDSAGQDGERRWSHSGPHPSVLWRSAWTRPSCGTTWDRYPRTWRRRPVWDTAVEPDAASAALLQQAEEEGGGGGRREEEEDEIHLVMISVSPAVNSDKDLSILVS